MAVLLCVAMGIGHEATSSSVRSCVAQHVRRYRAGAALQPFALLPYVESTERGVG